MNTSTASNIVLVTCEMQRDCPNPVSHIGNKGYVYCQEHAVTRRAAGHERCRKMRPWEIALLKSGKPLPSYEPRSKSQTP